MYLHKLIFFYFFIFVPLAFLVALTKIDLISNNVFAACLLLYVVIYHPFISGKRLIELEIIKKAQFWKNFIPFWNFKYFDVLFLSK